MSAEESTEIKANSYGSDNVTEIEETATPVDTPESNEITEEDHVKVSSEASNGEDGETEVNEKQDESPPISEEKVKDTIEQDESVADEEESIDSTAVKSELASNISSAPNTNGNSLNDTTINRPKNTSGLKKLALSTSNIETKEQSEEQEQEEQEEKEQEEKEQEEGETDIKDNKKLTMNNNLSTDSIQKGLKNWFSFKTKSSDDLANETETDSTNNNNNNTNNNILSNLDITKKLSKPENFSFALFRFNENRDSFLSKSENDRDAAITGVNNLRNTFNEIKNGIQLTNDNELIEGIDWEFWSVVANDYSNVVKNEPDLLLKNIGIGIPRELRGMIWQIMTNSKSFLLEELFRNSKSEESSYEKAIKRDLARTSFITNSSVKSKVDDLYEIIKVYSLYDPEVGYTQGMAFITVPLLMNMEAAEAFCMLVMLMKNYGFRELYLPDMPGLHLKLYQFDRLIEDLAPDLHTHLKRQGIRSSMYATQWFLTLFGYKFPLDMVLRIYDVVIAEGIETILKFSVNLMLKSKEFLLTLQFDDLLSFLKEKIFYYYLVENDIESEILNDINNSTTNKLSRMTSNNSVNLKNSHHFEKKDMNLETFKLDEFVNDSLNIQILPITLKRYIAEFEEIHRLENERKEEIEEIRFKNGQLTREIRKIEAEYATLNREHIEVANEMVLGKVQIANLKEENLTLSNEVDDLRKRLSSLQIELENSKNSPHDLSSNDELSKNIELEVQRTMERNLEVMEENRLLEDQLNSLEDQYQSTKNELEELKLNHKELKIKWGALKKVFGNQQK
ncbi:hypothetical protein B5S28_g210 [[Candida] boidinii]|nr:hypothetical protein B5S28_g210 [[Candida] boidinii]OWB59939.1 hypothetical protein B5S29_g804 [[Candida] boidinii]OWB70537.1 hypothetical protein B5S31_g215 [[Candida] boidinii]OWB77384.1 hypothetical protein B5S32_g1548 [[Candida] boidinii]